MKPMSSVLRLSFLVVGLCSAFSAGAQRSGRAPQVQMWMDVSTGGMAGMPETTMPLGIGGLFGGRSAMGGDNSGYGAARGTNIMPPRVLDIALHNSLKPGVEAAQLIPAGMRMGDSLPLVPRAEPAVTVRPDMSRDSSREKPKGRLLIYWGCGESVRSGQPRVIDMARANPSDFATVFSGQYAADRSERVDPQFALYPNEKNRVSLSRDSSLAGEHQLQGEGIPASMKFTLGAAQDLMPAIELETRGKIADSLVMSWKTIPFARAYYLHAMGRAGEDTVMWSSAETGNAGMGLLDYLPNDKIQKWLKESVLLQPETTQCAIPKGIFAGDATAARGGNEGQALLRMMAYGGESRFSSSSRSEPEWAVRVRVKSNITAALGAEPMAGGAAGGSQVPGLPVPNPLGLLKGLFGR